MKGRATPASGRRGGVWCLELTRHSSLRRNDATTGTRFVGPRVHAQKKCACDEARRFRTGRDGVGIDVERIGRVAAVVYLDVADVGQRALRKRGCVADLVLLGVRLIAFGKATDTRGAPGHRDVADGALALRRISVE